MFFKTTGHQTMMNNDPPESENHHGVRPSSSQLTHLRKSPGQGTAQIRKPGRTWKTP